MSKGYQLTAVDKDTNAITAAELTDVNLLQADLEAGLWPFGPNLFDEWRYLDEGQPGQDCSSRPLNEEFVLNQPRFKGASVMIARINFGCGSSREHAPWAMTDFGFKAVIAPSFADIFFNNCFKNGLLPIVLDEDIVNSLFQNVESNDGFALEIDLENQVINCPDNTAIAFDVDAFRKHCLLNGLDDIGITLKDTDAIKAFEAKYETVAPWVFNAIKG
ncbi:MAG: 3-isopropylmalate dehydratase small subunit [Gammaproteobacteria bacterium]|nr:MAG: 3-isopropylmalate dehydratase small subunit [Gammaproteobacteria bacterium]